MILVLTLEKIHAQVSIIGNEFDPTLNSLIYKNQFDKVKREYSKEVVVVRFLDPNNARIEFELTVWEHFINAVDSSLIGFVFYSPKATDSFQQIWNKSVGSSASLIIDEGQIVNKANEISEDPTEHTLVMDRDFKILEQVGSPILNENFDDLRNTIAKNLLKNGFDHGVKGAIHDKDANNRTWFMAQPIYVTSTGSTIPQNEALKLIVDGSVFPEYSPLSDTVRLIKRR